MSVRDLACEGLGGLADVAAKTKTSPNKRAREADDQAVTVLRDNHDDSDSEKGVRNGLCHVDA